MDGGTIWDVNISSAINQCLELVDHPSQIIVDVMICGYDAVGQEAKSGNTIQNMMRKRSWQSYYSGMNSFAEQERAYPDVNYRYLFQQKHSSIDPLDFNKSTTHPLWVHGVEDAVKALGHPEKAGFVNLTEWLTDNSAFKKGETFESGSKAAFVQ